MRGRSVGCVAGALLVAACGVGESDLESELELLELSALSDFSQTADPSVALDPETGDLLLAWGGASAADEWDLWFARSSDGGTSFSTPVRVNDQPGDLYPHAEGSPRLVAATGVVALFWNNRLEVEGRRFAASDLRFARTADGGATWSPAVNLQDPLQHSSLPPRGNTFHGAAWDGDSTLVVAWLDGRERDDRRIERGRAQGLTQEEAARSPEDFEDAADPHDGDATVFAAVSHDLGVSWEPENRRIEGRVCPCCRVSLALTPQGELLGAWREHFPGSVRDPVMRPVLNAPQEGATLRIHEDEWEYPGCPHSGPGLDVDPAGTIHAAWYTGAEGRRGIYHARRYVGNDRFSPPTPVVTGEAVGVAHPAVVALPDGGAVLAQNVDEEGRRVIGLAHLSPEGEILHRIRVPDSDGGTHPQLLRLDDLRIVVAWTESRRGIQRARAARMTLLGAP
jgi:hypothetical protein